MADTVLYDAGGHRNVLLPSFDEGHAVPANQHLIIHAGVGMILDPGGHKVYNKVLAETTSQLKGGKLGYVFLSHQDPDIVAAVNGWLMTTDADAYASKLWLRFIPHFGLDKLVQDRLFAIPDEGQNFDLNGCQLKFLPAHFLHSCGNFQVYDPISKVLYTGDLGASLGQPYVEVTDFDAHLQYTQGFHERYMACNAAMRAWAQMVKQLDIEIIAPQHGAFFRGKEMVGRFITWAEELRCGVDLISNKYVVPQ
ncbi:MAG: MBL fold metallo-hydrolase [Polyangiaceae bacterium]